MNDNLNKAITLPENAQERMQKAVKEMLLALGENPEREGLQETPKRVAKAWLEFFSGLYENPGDHLKTRFSSENCKTPVIVRDIPFISFCEHHLLPVTGKVHLAYLSNGKEVTGLSKLARMVNGYARRPQLQERLTKQILEALIHDLEAKAALVIIEAEHACMSLRGIRAAHSCTTTFEVAGEWEENLAKRQEIFSLLKPSSL
ncbi:GTP cyclohydrolase I FolE [Acetobacteraceae bacterium]|nr:GTP cyclohydrolase I FolE [Acetobacteraceae bacterium]